MKGNEIKLNNWVYNSDYRAIQIGSIWKDQNDIDWVNYKSDFEDWDNLNEMHPIELTEAILVNCGFKKTQYEYILGDFIMEMFHDGYHYTGGEGCMDGVPILYLHQLQNIYFAHTNEEIFIYL